MQKTINRNFLYFLVTGHNLAQKLRKKSEQILLTKLQTYPSLLDMSKIKIDNTSIFQISPNIQQTGPRGLIKQIG